MADSSATSSRPRVLSGMRPTGKLHLGNYMGALANWVRLQETGNYECYFFVADLHALTTDYEDPSNILPNTREVALDFLAAGLDPKRTTIFVQSHVAQHFELPLLLGMITPLGWLERVPSYKEMQENLTDKDLSMYGFLGYPVLMASDILLYQAAFVPVGQDQQAHVELTREVARRFNNFVQIGRAGGAAGAAGAADALAQAAGHRRAQDVEELREHDPDHRSGAGGARQAEDHGDGPGAHPAHGPGRPGQMPGGRPAQGVFDAGDDGEGVRGLPHGGDWVHRMQRLGG